MRSGKSLRTVSPGGFGNDSLTHLAAAAGHKTKKPALVLHLAGIALRYPIIIGFGENSPRGSGELPGGSPKQRSGKLITNFRAAGNINRKMPCSRTKRASFGGSFPFPSQIKIQPKDSLSAKIPDCPFGNHNISLQAGRHPSVEA